MTIIEHGDDTAHPRLVLSLRPTDVGTMGGRWWPRTDDLARELPTLVAAVTQHFGAVDRISLDPESWSSRPRTITIDGRVVLLDWFGARHRHTVELRGPHSSHLDLLVIPFDTAPVVALACLTMRTAVAPTPERRWESRWEDDGGRLRELDGR